MAYTSESVLRGGRWVLLLLTIGLLVFYGHKYRGLPAWTVQTADAVAITEWPEPVDFEQARWEVFRKVQGNIPGGESPLAKRFRLAGTFFSFNSVQKNGEGNLRKAIVHDIAKKTQYLVAEGDAVEEYKVARIYNDRIVLRSRGIEEDLWLSFAGGEKKKTKKSTKKNQSLADMPALERSRFGKRVGENQWVFKREALLEYYHEVLDDPERIASLFMSMKPDYQEGVIAGYYLEKEGEDEFYNAAGLQEGDTVRKVNSMRMTSRARAEYFIREFANDRVNAIVLDVEREGQEQKLIYLIR